MGKKLKQDLGPLRAAHQKLHSFESKKRVIENDINHLRGQQKAAHSRMTCEYEETDEELQGFLANHDQQIREKENALKLLRSKYEKFKTELMAKKQTLSQLHQKRGKIQQIIEDNKNKQNELLKIINKLMQRYNMQKQQIFENLDNSDSKILENNSQIIDKMINALHDGQKNKKIEMEQHQTSTLQSDQLLEKEINDKVTKKNNYDFRAKELMKQQRDCKSKRQQFNRTMSNIQRQLNDCQNIETQIASIQSKVDEFNSNDPTKKWEQQINECQANTKSNSDKMKILSQERKALESQSAATAKLTFKREQYQKANANYKDSMNKIKTKIVSVLNDMPSMDRLENDFCVKQNALKSEFEIAQKKYNQMQTQQTVSASKLSSIQREKEKMQRNLSNDIIKLSEKKLSMDDDIDALIERARDNASAKQSDLALSKCGRTLYSKFNKIAAKKNLCPVCTRHFQKKSELKSFLDVNTKRIKQVAESGAIEKHKRAANKAQEKLDALQDMLPIYQNAMKQREELQNLEEEFKKLTVQTQKFGENMEELFAQHIESKAAYDKSSSLMSNVNEVCRRWKNAQREQKEYETEKKKLKDLTKNKKSLNDVVAEYDKLQNQMNQSNALQSNLRQKIGAYDQKKRSTQNQLIALQQKSANYEKLKNEQLRINEDVNKLNQNEENLTLEITKLQSQIEPMEQAINQQRNKRHQQRSSAQQKERTLQQYLNKFNSDIHNLQNKAKEYKSSQQKVSKYGNIANDIEAQQNAFKALEQQFNVCSATKRETEKWLDNVVIDKQDLMSNLEFRKFKNEYNAKKKELEVLRAEMNEIAPNADNISNDIERIQTKIAIKQSSMDQMKGAKKSESNKAVEMMGNLRTDRYEGVDEKYRCQLIKYETTLIAHKDLDKFEKALDKSLIEFHSLKMKEINSVLKELWQQTYRGKDIDYIEIECKEKGAATKKRKTYNYSVVMIQGDARLSMRGRCSAGQRVLASLLIRLALAETFCLNCGVLALDEPTTNLDSKNIEALAFALNQIVTRRKRQENFQLILITHDEAFVEKLGQREHTDGYYRVFKNDQCHSKAKLYKFNEPMNRH